ncbi:membrane protein [Jannaschia pagri]|uniref:Membrane protein n=1 Tax=Jannaschia pagri TaxID=2829797 RepID=A0ABQ4NHU9_9RHOB|nr:MULTISPECIES: prepilin peptidase [unclassified Jannaschia]GIT89916.1 membrane protein [Jannaschia sp. AI_61]GIT93977.1 membrane protein [Jannaschia sp. AI_62]
MFETLAITSQQGLIWGLLTLPITAWVMWTDLTDMKIKNQAVLAMLAIFVVSGFFLLPLEDYLWRYAHFAVVLVICFVLSATIGMGAGDAKYIAAVAPFVALDDVSAIALLYAFWAVVLLVGMFIARRIGAVRRAYPDWIWLAEDRKSHVPFGLALAPTVTSYFAYGATLG